MLHERDTKKMLSQISNTSSMFNTNHGGDKDVVDGLNNKSSGFPYKGITQSCEQGDSLVRPKDVMEYVRGKITSKTTLRASLVLI